MELLHNGFTLEFSEGAFPLGTDSIALADFVSLPKSAQVLDLGSGCGTLGLMLCAKWKDCTVTGVEIAPDDHAMAQHNAKQNDVDTRLISICGDVNQVPELFKPGRFNICVSNPPYFTGGPKSKTLAIARSEESLSLEALFAGAAWALRYGGDFYLVHRPERLAELCATAVKHGLEPKVLRLLRHRADKEVTLVLLKCRKGGKPGLKWEEFSLYDANGAQTDYYKHLYHL